MRRSLLLGSSIVLAFVLGAGPAFACGGLVAPNGAVRLARTTTLAAYHDGLEHYVTSFEFVSGAEEFGSIVPLPGIPSKVERGGDWTLQRLRREVEPPPAVLTSDGVGGGARSGGARVVYETQVDALDITILEGGGQAVADWAAEHGFALSEDAPEVLEFYAERSPIFMAARFDAQRAREENQGNGDGTPVHLTIPTDNPWVPLRILGLAKPGEEIVEADVFLLTDRKPALLPVRAPGWSLERREPASAPLLDDLRSDEGMDWVPQQAWLTHLRMDAEVRTLTYDLAVDVTGKGLSWDAAGLEKPAIPAPRTLDPTSAPTPVVTLTPVPSDDDIALAPTSTQRERDVGMVAWALAAVAAALGGVFVLRRRT